MEEHLLSDRPVAAIRNPAANATSPSNGLGIAVWSAAIQVTRCGIFMLLTAWSVNVAAIEPRYASLLNDPTIQDARLATAGDDWRLTLGLRFMNEFVADAGVRVEYLDIPITQRDPAPSLRLVFARQRIRSQCSPDIFQPTTTRVEVVMRRSDAIRTLVLMNTGADFANSSSGLRIHLLDVAKQSNESGIPANVTTARIRAIPLAYGTLPTLDQVSVSTAPKARGADRMRVGFDVVAPEEELGEGVAVFMYEDPPRGEDGELHVWMIVQARAGEGAKNGEAVQLVRETQQVTTEIGTQYRRKLVLVNRMSDARETRENPFTVVKIP